jgi:putative tricarboxylic transport membrane protein
MKFNDAIVGAAFVALAALQLGLIQGLHTPPGQKFGPGFFPTITALVMGLAGLALLAKTLVGRAGGKWVTLDPWFGDRRLALQGAAVFAAIVAYLLFSESLGFLVVAPLILWGLITLLWGRPLASLAIALAASFAIHQFFVQLLLVPLPWGIVPYFRLF